MCILLVILTYVYHAAGFRECEECKIPKNVYLYCEM
jgi:hypothetical protein